MMDFGHLEFIASCSIFVGVHWCLSKSQIQKAYSPHQFNNPSSIDRLITFRPASVTNLWIGEAVAKASFGIRYSELTEFLNTKWRQHVL